MAVALAELVAVPVPATVPSVPFVTPVAGVPAAAMFFAAAW